MSVTLYGIKQCDTVKKARKWLEANKLAIAFHDFRVDGLSKSQIQIWIAHFGLDKVVNKRSTTWRQLPDADKNGLTEQSAVDLLLKHPTLIKRPILETPTQLLIGFDAKVYERAVSD